MADVTFKGTPFKEAIDFFQAKVRVPTRTYTDMMNKAHSKGFMVAGAMKDELLADFQEVIGRCLRDGLTLEDFRKDFDRIVAAHGWSYNGTRGWRTRVIFETNIRTSYAAGRWQQAQRTKRMRPYGRYVHTPNRHPREEHVAWDGKIVPLDDPWWDFRWPPNGWGCKCAVETVSEQERQREGWQIWNPPPDNTRSVAVKTPDGMIHVETVEGVDPSFAYNPGKSATGMRLSPRQVKEAREDGTWKNWRPVPWGDASRESWRSLGRPETLPPDTPKAKLAEKTSTVDELRPVLEKMIGADSAFFAAADGTVVWLSVETLLHVNPDRSPFLPFIPEVLATPYEVWMDFEEHATTGRVELKKRYVKRLRIGGKEMGLIMVVQVSKGQLVGWTFIPTERGRYLDNLRRGKLLWKREE